MSFVVTNGREAAAENNSLVRDVHSPNRCADAEQDVTSLGNTALDRAEQAVGRKPVAVICHALVEWLAFTDLIVELGLR